MLSSRLLGKSGRPRDEHRRVVRLADTAFAGHSVHDLGFGEAGCAVLAVERDGQPQLLENSREPLGGGDALWVCGTADALKAIRSRIRS
jgi:K+/H+ antiporter YhaU regulatory subunit KhtT